MIRAHAPATTANLGPGFDAAGAALGLWNEVELEEGPFRVEIAGEGADELPRDAAHLALQAFALLADPERFTFSFTNRIPLERGLGSSAAAIALGLVAGTRAAGRQATADELLALGEPLEGHLDNLGAVLSGGVCIAWHEEGTPRVRRIADDMPVAAIVAIPTTRTSTAASRGALPAAVPHADAAATAGAAMLLGAAVAAGDADLLAAGLRDRLHEPYRSEGAPLLERVRAERAPGVIGVTLSGSGPTVIAWTRREHADAAAAALESSLGADATVRQLAVTGGAYAAGA